MKRKFKVPLWVELVYRALDWMDRKILSPASSTVMSWRNSLLDKYCQCERCQQRKWEAEQLREQHRVDLEWAGKQGRKRAKSDDAS